MLRFAVPLAVALCVAILAAPAMARETGAAGPMKEAMAAEFAVSAGRLDEAVDWYLQAARAAPDDAALAARATRYALMGRDDRALKEALELWRKRAPETLAMRAADATLALRTGKQRAARRGLEALLRDGGARGWLSAFAVLGTGSRDPALSARVLGQLFERGALPTEPMALSAAGQLALGLGDDALFGRIDAVARELHPDDPVMGLLRVRHLHRTGRSGEAREVLDALATGDALAGPRIRERVALTYAELGDPAAGAVLLDADPAAAGDLAQVALRASLLAEADDKDALAALYAGLAQGAGVPNPARRLLLGQVAEFLERPGEALDWYRSVPGGEQRATARLRATKVLHDLERGDEAYEALRALQQDADADERLRRDAYLMESELRREDGDAAAELDALARGLAAFADEPALLYSRALMWERNDDIPRAEADLRRILVADPDSTAALNALGYTLADRTDRYEEALELIERARIAEPTNAAIIDSYGWVLYRLGRHQEALVELRRAFVLEKDAEIASHVGTVLWQLGRRDEAMEWFEQARGIDPDNRALRRAMEEVGE
ncbi:membrane protein [Luteimonas terricola]|uniref:Membrane protein n=2 Tax=Luteimonas terricola TaxID=645597 RepID=A0ABQ2E9N2_9GAMM|nr:tetratricopeptide repeat protein [Luteimonas terricola]GGK00586.1 membrane protein [Luteimonas terricola]